MDVTYLDHNASSPVPQELLAELAALVSATAGNPSSLHKAGRKSRRLINEATEAAAKLVGTDPEFVYWTSGASEANSWAFHSALQLARSRGRSAARMIVSGIEHDSSLLAADFLRTNHRVEIQALRALPSGQVDTTHLRELLAQGEWDLVSVLFASNETGVIQPIEEIGQLCKEKGVPLHVDCVQALGKLPLGVRATGATWTTFSAHKIGGPKGVGFLVVEGEGKLLSPVIHGKQQKTLRGGTENALGIALFGRVLQLIEKGNAAFPQSLLALKSDFEAELKRKIPGTRVHGETAPRLLNTTFVGFDGTDGDGVLVNLDLEGVCASSGSACTSGSLDPSHVLLAMGCDKAMARSSVRFSAGRGTTWKDYERVLTVLPEIVERVRASK